MRRIDFTAAFKALNEFADKVNSEAKITSDMIRQPHIFTAQELIKLYSWALLRKEELYKYVDTAKFVLPGLKTNNTQLSQRLKVSTRTIKRHIKRLKDTAVITRKIFHGSAHQYEVWIDENILFPHVDLDLDDLKIEIAYLESFSGLAGTNWPHTEYSFNRTNIIYNTDVDMLTNKISKCEQVDGIGRSVSHNEILTGEETWKQGASPSTGILPGHVTGGGAPAEFSKQALYFRDQLWDYVKRNLYPTVNFSEHGEAKARECLNIYFQGMDEARLPRLFAIYAERIDMVRRFIEKNPSDRFVPFPYKYFDVNNKNGFTATAKWFKLKQENLLQAKKNSILKSILGNYEKACACEKLQNSLLEIFRKCEADAAALSCPDSLKKFYQQASKLSPVLFSKAKKRR